MIKAIIFDFWHTLGYRKSITYTLQKYKSLDKKRIKEVYETTLQTRKWDSFDKGFEELIKNLNLKISEHEKKLLKNRMQRIYHSGKLFNETKSVIKRLKKKYKIAVLSNATIFEKGQFEMFKIKKLVPNTFFSYELGVKKPDKRAFNYVMKKLKVKPNETVMVGDSYVEDFLGAKFAGMHAILVDRKNNQQIKNKIRSLKSIEKKLEGS